MEQAADMTLSRKRNKILVIGDIMLDQYIIGDVERQCPEAPAPVLTVENTYEYLGGAANVAANIKNLGGQVLLAGVVGRDEEGSVIKKMLKNAGIPLVLGMDGTRPTTVKKRIGTRERLLVRADRESQRDISAGIFQEILKIVAILSEDLKIVVVSDYGKGVVTPELFSAISEICKAKGVSIFVDPKGHCYKKYDGVDLIKPNFYALEMLYGQEIHDLESLEKAVEMVFSTTGCRVCIVTWESNGALLFTSPGQWRHFPCDSRTNAAYVSGAGDVFMAGLSMGEALELPTSTACQLATQLAAGALGGIGTLLADKREWVRLCKEVLDRGGA